MKGFLQINRNIFNGKLWKEKRQFSRFEAYLDILQSACIYGTKKMILRGNREITCNENEFIASFRYLAERWGWTVHKVQTFISNLIKENLISCQSKDRITIITVKNSGTSNGLMNDVPFCVPTTTPNDTPNYSILESVTDINDTQSGTSNGTYIGTSNGTSNGTNTKNDITKNVLTKNDNKDIEKERKTTNVVFPKKDELSLNPAKSEKDEDIDFDKLMQIYNTKFAGRLPAIQKMTDQRKTAVRARVKEWGKDKIMEVFQKVYDSDFCNGVNDKGWKADFDFIFTKSKFTKIIEGTYDNRKRISQHASVLRDIAKDVFSDSGQNTEEDMEREREIQRRRALIWGTKPRELENTDVQTGRKRIPG